ncbi:PaaI family thioesterase [Candidatus Leptofilum sp.]|uniref:PaaI family thioesterase n=1 Tax=Candidatus Leptofilum sp. TaxID=3241576 RepID=UPI003B58FCBE
MTQFNVQNPDYEQTVRASFAQQGFMAFLGAELTAVSPGEITIELPVSASLSQQHGFVHAGATTAVVDSACGYAALTLMPPGSEVVTVEFKVNLLAPALGVKMIAIGRVVRPGRMLTVCQGELFGEDETGARKRCALMTATMIQR